MVPGEASGRRWRLGIPEARILRHLSDSVVLAVISLALVNQHWTPIRCVCLPILLLRPLHILELPKRPWNWGTMLSQQEQRGPPKQVPRRFLTRNLNENVEENVGKFWCVGWLPICCKILRITVSWTLQSLASHTCANCHMWMPWQCVRMLGPHAFKWLGGI